MRAEESLASPESAEAAPSTEAAAQDQVAPVGSKETQSPPAEAPRPPTGEDIQRMIDDAASRAAADAGGASRGMEILSYALLWSGVAVALAAAVYLFFYGGVDPLAALASAGFVIGSGLVVVGATRPELLSGFMRGDIGLKARDSDSGDDLAGGGVLAGLGVAEDILARDPDGRLVTRPEGVVVYANAAYRALATEAGVAGPAGLPPRLDRLFAQQGPDASKIFRLCRAARNSEPATEAVFQRIGLEAGGARRRFEISVAPVETRKPYVAWRIREVPVEKETEDPVATAYGPAPLPIISIDRGGGIVSANDEMRARFDLGVGAASVEDLILGDVRTLIDALWRCDGAPEEALVRAKGAPKEGAPATFRAFRRGGVGEGVVYVAIDIAAEDPADAVAASVAGEVTEAPFGVAIVEGEFGREAKIVEANGAFLSSFQGAAKGATLSKVLPLDAIADLAAEARKKQTATPRPVDAEVRDGADAARAFSVYVRTMRRKRGGYGPKRAFLYSVEITETKRMQEDHVQDQKLKAIGNIAGEVAHDFNNLLQVVLASCEDLLVSHPAGDPAYADLLLIRQNAQRAANLTRQLLAYSRKQTLTSKSQSITDLLMDFSPFLDRAVGEKVRLKLKNGRGLPKVKIDTNQFETALMNLAVNARDAMAPEGGDVRIETECVMRESVASLGLNQLRDQDHLLVSVIDTGPGVPDDIRTKIFDPFFTTKDVGKGTGLGLSAVQGVIEQMGGAITVENLSEGGAAFRIYLPACEADDQEEAPAETAPPVAADVDYSGVGRILVVEDEPGVRLVVVKTLERAGYEVDVADDGVEALEMLEQDAGYDLVISDIMMPEVDGPAMVAEARKRFDLKAEVVFMSGYAEAAVREQLDEIERSHFIQKPFQKADLSVLVRKIIHGDE
ncbi:MAG: response regulator [Pseudomonadota bacterium]